MPESDAATVSLAEPFGVFFQREFHTMVTLAQAVSGDPSAGEDIAADAMLKASQRWETVGSYDRPGAWVRRVTINLATNRRRRLLRERDFLRRRRASDAVVPAPPTRDDELMAAVAALPPKQRAAVALRYLEDMSVSDIAAVLECSESTVNSHLHKARTTLARVLATGGQS